RRFAEPAKSRPRRSSFGFGDVLMSVRLPIIEMPGDGAAGHRSSSTDPNSRASRGLPRQTDLGRHAEDFIRDDQLTSLLGRPSDRQQVRDVIAKSLAKQPLEVLETAVLLNVRDP